jgi:hypothetical protein
MYFTEINHNVKFKLFLCLPRCCSAFPFVTQILSRSSKLLLCALFDIEILYCNDSYIHCLMLLFCKIQFLSPLQFLYVQYPSTASDNILQIPPIAVTQKIVPSWKVRDVLQQGFPTGQANCTDSSSDTACGVGRVYRCCSWSFKVAGGCTTLIKRSFVCHMYEQPYKELQTSEL